MYILLSSDTTLYKVETFKRSRPAVATKATAVLSPKVNGSLPGALRLEQAKFVTVAAEAAYSTLNYDDRKKRLHAVIDLSSTESQLTWLAPDSTSVGLGYAIALYLEWRSQLDKYSHIDFEIFATGEIHAGGLVTSIDHLSQKITAACNQMDQQPLRAGKKPLFVILYPEDNQNEVTEDLVSRVKDLEGTLIPVNQLSDAMKVILGGKYNGVDGEWEPFKGLQSFNYEDDLRFLGREDAVKDLLKNYHRCDGLLVVAGISGCGKSSLVKAGLIPELEYQLSDDQKLHWHITTPKDGFSIKSALEELFTFLINSWEITESADHLCEKAINQQGSVDIKGNINNPCLFFIDQYEEIFNNAEIQMEQALGLAPLLERIANQTPGLTVVISVRREFIDKKLDGYGVKHFVDEKITSSDWDSIILKQAKLSGLDYEDNLAKEIRDEALDAGHCLPIVEYLLNELYERAVNEKKPARKLQRKHYKELGGIKGVIANRAQEAIDTAPELTDTFFDYFVGQNSEGEIYARSVDLNIIQQEQSNIYKLVQSFINERLVIDCGSKENAKVNLAHDILLFEWETLKDWVEQHKDYLTWRSGIDGQLVLWQKSLLGDKQRSKDLLITNKEQYRYGKKAWKNKTIKNRSVARYVELSIKNKHRRFAIASVLFAIFVVLPGVFGTFFLQKSSQDEIKKVAKAGNDKFLIAESNRLLALAKKENDNGNYDTAMLLALNAMPGKYGGDRPMPESLLELRRALQGNHRKAVFKYPIKWRMSSVFSPDEKQLAIAADKGIVAIVDIESGKEIFKLQHEYEEKVIKEESAWSGSKGNPKQRVTSYETYISQLDIFDIAFSSDGKNLITVSRESYYEENGENTSTNFDKNGFLSIWSLQSGKLINSISVEHCRNISLSQNGERYVCLHDGRVEIVSTEGENQAVITVNNDAYLAELSHDGKSLAVLTQDHVNSRSTVVIFDVLKKSVTKELKYDRLIKFIAVDKNSGDLVIPYSLSKGKVRTFNIKTGEQTAEFIFTNSKDKDWKTKLDGFSISTDRLCQAVPFGTQGVRVFMTGYSDYVDVIGADSSIRTALFSKSGEYLLTSSTKDEITIWNTNYFNLKYKTSDETGVLKYSKFIDDNNALLMMGEDSNYWIQSLDNNINTSLDNKFVIPSSDSKKLFASTEGGMFQVLSAESGIVINEKPLKDDWRSNSFSDLEEKVKFLHFLREDLLGVNGEKCFCPHGIQGRENHFGNLLASGIDSVIRRNSPDRKIQITRYRGKDSEGYRYSVESLESCSVVSIFSDDKADLILFSDDSKFIFLVYNNGGIRIIPVDNNYPAIDLKTDNYKVQSVYYIHELNIMLTINVSGHLQIWDTVKKVKKYDNLGKYKARRVVFSNHSLGLVAIEKDDGVVNIFDIQKIKVINQIKLNPTAVNLEWQTFAKGFAFSSNGSFLIASFASGQTLKYPLHIDAVDLVNDSVINLPVKRTCLTPAERTEFRLSPLSADQWLDRGCPQFVGNTVGISHPNSAIKSVNKNLEKSADNRQIFYFPDHMSSDVFNWLRLAKEKNDADAQFNLSMAYISGRGAFRDNIEAVKWMVLAAEQGHLDAQYTLAITYLRGRGKVEKDFAEALKWLYKAAENGHAQAQLQLGKLYYSGQVVKKDYKSVIKWFNRAAKKGLAKAQFNLASMYEDGEGLKQDYLKAIKFYKLAADQKYDEAQFNLGLMYLEGHGTPKNSKKGIKLLNLAADQGNAVIQYNLGTVYSNGNLLKVDYKVAVKWFKSAANQGMVLAQRNMGIAYGNGAGVNQNYLEAIKWYRLAASQGDIISQNNLGVIYVNGLGVEIDYEEGIKWYEKAAEQGDARSQFNMGLLYDVGRGVKQDYIKAIDWYKKAANQGGTKACFNLGGIYTTGVEGIERDYKEGLKWYMLAAENGDAEAQNNVGIFFSQGKGVSPDNFKAFKWWSLAASQGHILAQYNLAERYYYGEGVEQNTEMAIIWFEKAADSGLEQAKARLKQIKK